MNPNLIYLLEGVLHSNKEYDRYRSKKDDEPNVIELSINAEHKEAIGKLENLMAGIFTARDLINTPPIDLYPESYAKQIVEMFKGTDVEVEVYNKKQIETLNMHALLAVASGSDKDPRLVVLKRLPLKEKEHVTIVGKV